MLGIRYYRCLWAFAICSPQLWSGDEARLRFHVETVAGSAAIGDGGAALGAQCTNIQGIAVDRAGNLYLADTGNHRVRKVAGGIISTIAGTGVAGFGGDGQAAVKAQLNLPYGVAVDAVGNVYVADLGNGRVRRINPDGTITTVAGTGKRASSPDGAAPLDTSLLSPRNVAVDAAGNVYIAEFEGHRVRRLGTDGRLVTLAGTGVAGYRGDGDRATLAQLNYPAGLAFDRAGALYIADSSNNVVRKIYADGTIGTVLGRTAATALFTPIAIAVDAAGTVYTGDSTFAVRAYTAAAKWITFAGTGAPGYSGDGAAAVGAAMSAVNDLAADAAGNLWIADGVRVRRVDGTGTIQSVAGDGYAHAVGDGGAATAANLYQPAAVALDGAGNLYIADTGTERVRQVAAGGTIGTLAGTGAIGLGAAGGAAAGTALYAPAGVAMDWTGRLLIADTFNHRIVAVNAAHQLAAVAGTGTPGVSGDGAAPLVAQLRGPRGICEDLGGTLYIADTSNHRVMKIVPGGVLQTAAGNGSPGYAGEGGTARLAQLNAPGACAVDSAGTLFIADTGNHAIRRVTADGIIVTVAGTGAAGGVGDEGAAVAAQLASPRGVAVNDSGELFIADTGNHRIRMVTADGVIHTIAGTGAAGFAGDGGAGTAAQLNAPQGLSLDGAGDLYFADTGNNRVRRLLPDVARVVAPDPVSAPPALAVVNAISLQAGAVAPGEIVTLYGAGLGPQAGITAGLDASGALPVVLGGVSVQFGGSAAPLFYAQSGQINAQVPYTVVGSDTVNVQVQAQGKTVASASVAVASTAPALLGLATNQDGTVNGAANPAARETWMTFYATGEGLTDGANAAGMAAAAPLAHPLAPLGLTVAGVAAEILFAGEAPGLIGVLQINAVVPGGFVAPGEAAVRLTVGTASSPAIPVWLR